MTQLAPLSKQRLTSRSLLWNIYIRLGSLNYSAWRGSCIPYPGGREEGGWEKGVERERRRREAASGGVLKIGGECREIGSPWSGQAASHHHHHYWHALPSPPSCVVALALRSEREGGRRKGRQYALYRRHAISRNSTPRRTCMFIVTSCYPGNIKGAPLF